MPDEPAPPPQDKGPVLSGAALQKKIDRDAQINAIDRKIEAKARRRQVLLEEVWALQSERARRIRTIRKNAVDSWVNKRRHALLQAMKKPDFELHESVLRLDTAAAPNAAMSDCAGGKLKS